MSSGGAFARLMESPAIARFLREGLQVSRPRVIAPQALDEAIDAGEMLSRTFTYRFPIRIAPYEGSRGQMVDRDLMRVHINETLDPGRIKRGGFDPNDPPIEQSDVDFTSARADARERMGLGSQFDEVDTDPSEKLRILRRVPAIVVAHARAHRPDGIAWDGTSGSRDKLYATMARMLEGEDYVRPKGFSHLALERVSHRGLPKAGPGRAIPPKETWRLPILSLLAGVPLGSGALAALASRSDGEAA